MAMHALVSFLIPSRIRIGFVAAAGFFGSSRIHGFSVFERESPLVMCIVLFIIGTQLLLFCTMKRKTNKAKELERMKYCERLDDLTRDGMEKPSHEISK